MRPPRECDRRLLRHRFPLDPCCRLLGKQELSIPPLTSFKFWSFYGALSTLTFHIEHWRRHFKISNVERDHWTLRVLGRSVEMWLWYPRSWLCILWTRKYTKYTIARKKAREKEDEMKERRKREKRWKRKDTWITATMTTTTNSSKTRTVAFSSRSLLTGRELKEPKEKLDFYYIESLEMRHSSSDYTLKCWYKFPTVHLVTLFLSSSPIFLPAWSPFLRYSILSTHATAYPPSLSLFFSFQVPSFEAFSFLSLFFPARYSDACLYFTINLFTPI